MIHVSLSRLLFIYLFVFLAAIFLAWVLYAWAGSRREKSALRYRVRCVICAFDFEDRTNTTLPQCPRCGSLNERLRLGTL